MESSQPRADNGASLPIDAASWPRRSFALVIDWMACTFVVIGVIGREAWSDNANSGFLTLGLFLAESALLTAIAGGSFGKLATGLRVVRLSDGRPPGLLPSLARQLAVCLVIPPLVFKPDGRGLHDIWTRTKTIVLRRAVGKNA